MKAKWEAFFGGRMPTDAHGVHRQRLETTIYQELDDLHLMLT